MRDRDCELEVKVAVMEERMGTPRSNLEATRRQPVASDELEAAFRIPAPGANRFVVNIGQPGVRISFGEANSQLDGPALFHSAVTLHPVDAIALRDLLKDTLQDIEKQIFEISAGQENG